MEEEILQFSRSENIFQKSIDERPKDNAFSFYDGPPFATGLPALWSPTGRNYQRCDTANYKTMRG